MIATRIMKRLIHYKPKGVETEKGLERMKSGQTLLPTPRGKDEAFTLRLARNAYEDGSVQARLEVLLNIVTIAVPEKMW
jgi:hypothetical protein